MTNNQNKIVYIEDKKKKENFVFRTKRECEDYTEGLKALQRIYKKVKTRKKEQK